MNKQEIEKERVCAECINYKSPFHQCLHCDISEVLNSVFLMMEQQLTNGWIPVSERLPEYTDDYNVTVSVGSELGFFEEVRTYRYEIYNGAKPYKKWIIPNNISEVVNIIAWQPLPESYKEESE